MGHARNVLNSMIDEAFPKIGHLPITTITAPQILDVPRRIWQRIVVKTATS